MPLAGRRMPDRGCGPTEIGADDGNEEEDDCVVVLTSHWVSPVGRRLVEGFQMVKKLNLWCGLVIFLRIFFFNNLNFVTSYKKTIIILYKVKRLDYQKHFILLIFSKFKVIFKNINKFIFLI